MTIEEIKNTPELVDFLLDECVLADSRAKVRKRLEEICDMAIKALEQESCETIKEIPKDYKYDTETENFLVYRHMYTGHEIHIEKPVPRYRLEQEPFTSQPKTGHWIDRFPAKECKCSVCDFLICISNGSYIDMVGQMKYCPNCGAKMIELQEGEDEE